MAARWDQRVCLAAAFLIADRVAADRSSVDVLEVPEAEMENQGQKVELICSVGGERVAFEHTQIESYENEIRDGHHISVFMSRVTKQLAEELPAGTLTLGVPTDVVLGLTGNAAKKAAAELAAWIDQNSRALADGYNNENLASHHLLLDTPIKGRLWFRPGDGPGKLGFARSTPDGLEEERAQRIKTAYESKLPKLSTELENGGTRCLVLENRDMSLGNAMLIRSAAKTALIDHRDMEPEWLLLVDTGIDPAEWLVLARSGDWPEFDPSEFSLIEIPGTLDL